MPDISMCGAADCPVSRRCYRHAASGTKPSALVQSYQDYVFEPGVGCSGFWDVAHRFSQVADQPVRRHP